MSPSPSGAAPVRLAILEADIPQPKTNERLGGYGGVFTTLLQAACDTSTPPKTLRDELTISAHEIFNNVDAYPSLDDIDAILITGSRHNSFDDDAWILKLVEYTKAALATNRVRIVGICFGHQILSRALGAKVERNPKGWELAVTEVDLTAEGKRVFGLEKMRIHQMHTDIVSDFPAGAVALGGNEICAVQAMYAPGQYITVQGHPEFSQEIETEILVNRHKTGLFTDEQYTDSMARVAKEHDGVAIARVFLKFLRD